MHRHLPRTGRALAAIIALVAVTVLSARVLAQPGYGYGDADQLEPGVLAPQDEADYGVGLERGVLGPADELESGLIGLDDPIFQRGPRRAPLRPPGVVIEGDRLERGLIGLDDPIFRR